MRNRNERIAVKSRLILLPILLFPFVLAADDAPKPAMKSPPAIAAMKKHDLAAEKARAEYSRAMQAAQKQLITDLDVAEKGAVKSGSLDDALAIRAAKNDAQARLVEIQADDIAPDRSHLASEITGTDWRFSPSGVTVHCAADGLVHCHTTILG